MVVPTQEEENVHLIIKPIIVVNNTRIRPIPVPTKPNAPSIIPKKNITFPIAKEEEDCDILNLSPNYHQNMRFKVKFF